MLLICALLRFHIVKAVVRCTLCTSAVFLTASVGLVFVLRISTEFHPMSNQLSCHGSISLPWGFGTNQDAFAQGPAGRA